MTKTSGRSGASLPTISVTTDQDLFDLGVMLQKTQVNPRVLLRVIASLGAIGWGSGHGEIGITVVNRKVEMIKTRETSKLKDEDGLILKIKGESGKPTL